MIFEVKCDELTYEELTDRTHTRIVSFISTDWCMLVNYYFYLSWRVFLWLPVGGVWQGGVDPHLAAGTPEPVAQRLHRLGRALLPANRRGRGPPPSPRGRGLAVVAARLPRPHTRACTVLRVTATCHVSRVTAAHLCRPSSGGRERTWWDWTCR